MRLGLLALFRASSGWTGSLYKWPAWQLRSCEEHAGGVICEQLAEAFVKGGCVDQDVSFCHFGHGLWRWRAVGIGTDCLYDFVKSYW